MPIKLIGIIILMILVAVLTGFNLGNTCTIWFFHSFSNIPVFAALLAAFLLGVIITLPFTFKKGKKAKKDSSAREEVSAPETTEPAKTSEEDK